VKDVAGDALAGVVICSLRLLLLGVLGRGRERVSLMKGEDAPRLTLLTSLESIAKRSD
jgi:hypothetical protein